MKQKLLSILALLLMAVTGAWADDTYTVQFKANGNTKTVENVVLPHQFRCDFSSENGELDQIIKELYGLSGGYCNGDLHSSGNENVTCGSSDMDDYITISAPFEGTATVTGWYNSSTLIHYSLEISIPGYVAPTVNVTGVSLSETTASMTVGGDALTLTATVAPDDATDKTVTWTTSDAAVATVADGVVTAVGAGTATITATATNGTADTSDDKTATCAVTVSNPTVTANSDGAATPSYWSTYYNATKSFTADENTTVYKAALNGTSSVTLTEVAGREIAAGQAVILKSTTGTITLTPAATTSSDFTGNDLKGGTTVTSGNVAYTLSRGNAGTGAVGFYKFSVSLDGSKAHLEISTSAGTRSFIGFGDGTTAIEAPALAEDEAAEWYSLDGRRLSGKPARKGIYVKDGQKYIIK